MAAETVPILVVEDDPHVCELLRLYVERNAYPYELTVCHDGSSALLAAASRPFDLILLDVMLPTVDGWEVCRRLRDELRVQCPILLLTAKTAEEDKVLGLDLGADDYVTKPFSPRELMARIRAHLRRHGRTQVAEPATVQFAGLVIDPESHHAEVFGVPLNLTPKEFELLLTLARSPGQIFNRQQLLDRIWGYDEVLNTRTVDEHVRRIRRKLRSIQSPYAYVETVWGVGYRMAAAPW